MWKLPKEKSTIKSKLKDCNLNRGGVRLSCCNFGRLSRSPWMLNWLTHWLTDPDWLNEQEQKPRNNTSLVMTILALLYAFYHASQFLCTLGLNIKLLCYTVWFSRHNKHNNIDLVFLETEGDCVEGDISDVNDKCDDVIILVVVVRRTREETRRWEV